MKKRFKLNAPQIPWDRAKRSVLIIVFAALMEFVDPLPFFKSFTAWLLYAWLVFEIAKQFITYRLEVSNAAVAAAQRYKRTWQKKLDKFDPLARYRFRRFIIFLVGLFIYGWIISLFTDRCDGAIQCALLSVNLIVESIPMLLQGIMMIAFGMFQFVAMFWYLSGVGFAKIVMPGTIDVTFDDVFGQDNAKGRILEQVHLLEAGEAVERAGGYMPKGVLLTGPPGTGKTMLAKAAANLSTKPLILVPPGAFASTFIGINFLKVYRLGRYIRKFSKRYNGVIVFIDEIDVLGNRGGGISGGDDSDWWQDLNPHSECAGLSAPDHNPVVVTGGGGGGMNMGTLEAFLSMMDGMEEPRGLFNKVLAIFGFRPLPPPKVKVFYLGATNRPGAVDAALKRAGRLGLEIKVDYPKYEGRLNTYEGYLVKMEHSLEQDQVEWLARNHYRGTGAEIEDIVNEALLITFRKKDHEGVIEYDDVMEATLWKRFGESSGTFENPKNVWSVAIHEAGHALIIHKLMRERTNVWFGSIEQRGKTGGIVAISPKDDDWKKSHDELMADIVMSLASRAAEELVLGYMSNGHGGDGPAATKKAEMMVQQGHTFTIDYLDEEDGKQRFSVEGQMSFADDRDPEEYHKLREGVLITAYMEAREILTENKDALIALAELLQEKHTLSGTEIHKLLDGFDV